MSLLFIQITFLGKVDPPESGMKLPIDTLAAVALLPRLASVSRAMLRMLIDLSLNRRSREILTLFQRSYIPKSLSKVIQQHDVQAAGAILLHMTQEKFPSCPQVVQNANV